MFTLSNAFYPYIGGPGLTISLDAGIVINNGSSTLIPAQKVSLAANSTTFVFLSTTSFLIQSNTSGFPSVNCYPIAIVTTSNSGITNITDKRPDVGGTGSGSPVAGVDKNVQFNKGGTFGGDSDFNWDYTAHRLLLAGAESSQPDVLDVQSLATSNATTANMIGATFTAGAATDINTPTVTNSYGLVAIAQVGTGNGIQFNTVGKAYGIQTRASADAAAQVTTFYGAYIQNPVLNATAIVSNVYGLVIEDPLALSSVAIGELLSTDIFGNARFRKALLMDTLVSSGPGNNVNSAVQEYTGHVWTGSADTTDSWSISAVEGSGVFGTATSTLLLTDLTPGIGPLAVKISNGGNFATVSVPVPSPALQLAGQYWTGSASATDQWSLQDIIGAGANGSSTLVISQSGSTGAALVQVPALTSTTGSLFPYLNMTQVAADNMQRANENPLSDGGSWTASAGGVNAGQLVSNLFEATAVNTSAQPVWTANGATFTSANQYSEVTLATSNTSAVQIGPTVRAATAANTQYRLSVSNTLGALSQWTLYKIVAGAATTLGGPTSRVFNSGDKLRLAIQGSTLYCFHNGTLFFTASDAAIATGAPGMIAFESSGVITDAQISGWSGGTATLITSNDSGNITLINPTPATAGTQYQPPILSFTGARFSGGGSATDTWSVQPLYSANGAQSSLTFTSANAALTRVIINGAGGSPGTVLGVQQLGVDQIQLIGATNFGPFSAASLVTVGALCLNLLGNSCATALVNPGVLVGLNAGNNSDANPTSGTFVGISHGRLNTGGPGALRLAPASGNATLIGTGLYPVISQTGTSSGFYSALQIAVAESALKNASNNLLELLAGTTGATRYFTISGNNVNNTTTAAGVITTYNGIVTVANGVPSEFAQVNATAQAANIGSTTLYAVPAAGVGIYRINYSLMETQAATTSSTLPSLVLGWTDGDNSTVQSLTFSATAPGGNTLTTFFQGSIVVFAKASTNLTYQTTAYASTGATPMQYSLRIRVEAL